MSHLIALPVLLPLITGVLLLLLAGKGFVLTRTVSLISAGLLVVVSLLLFYTASSGVIQVYAMGDWAPPFGIVLVLDRLSAFMVLVTSVLAFFAIWYAASTMDHPAYNLNGLLHLLLLGVNGAFLTGDLFNLFVCFEVLLLASYALLVQGGGQERARAGLHYVVLNLAGSSLFLIAVATLYGITGTLNMADMAAKVANLPAQDAPIVAAAGLLFMVVFGLKAAMVPLYFWLPRAYSAASAPVAAMFAIMTKIGVYSIARVYTLIFGDHAGELANLIQPWLWPLALVTLALGVIGVLAARNLRMQVSYLVIISVGTLLAGLALNTAEALSATFYYLAHSTWVCGALYLIVDLIRRQRQDGSDAIHTGPALPQSTTLGLMFFVAALSVAGMPPLSGFVGKVLLLQSAGTGYAAIWLWGLVLLGGLASITALSRSGSTFFWRTTEVVANTQKASLLPLAAALGLLATTPALALWGEPIIAYTDALAEQLLNPGQYIDSVLRHTTVGGNP
ncbi:multisubunit potassium/proton antiporter PhaD subunit [Marinimicrobium koreense]|jgi:multicomponent K+:H+ antiporter subunit D|uniref:Multisubunit potassium/proton antiporter PhaD subunit n=1 Tax=Marinimicrobium koreense TaxID=306545 RepID=A0A3N1NXH1_9GAMM|nr:monovalent cation/H+ antiporter subunit D [Marinimicrobium koreense]ROQ20873.1 multisubunit potassium/proton antiporter PhaD subunit [Marinimicrobium koreense]